MYIGIVLGLLAGLGLFLYGMNLMGNGLQKAAGERLKKIIELLTRNRFIAVLVGVFVTGVIQSSSATTVMVVGFVNAGIMQLNQAIGVIMELILLVALVWLVGAGYKTYKDAAGGQVAVAAFVANLKWPVDLFKKLTAKK